MKAEDEMFPGKAYYRFKSISHLTIKALETHSTQKLPNLVSKPTINQQR